MPCGCGESYIVNEDYGFPNGRFPNGRKKDTSFRSFITFLFVFLLVLIVIYCIMLTVNKRKGENQQQTAGAGSRQNLHGNNNQTTTDNTIKFDDNNNNTNTTNYKQVHTESTKIVNSPITETTTVTESNQFETTGSNAYKGNQFKTDLEISKTYTTTKTTPRYDETTTDINTFNYVTHFSADHKTPAIDSSTQFNEVMTSTDNVKTTETNIEGMLTTDLTSKTELSENSSSLEDSTEPEKETTKIALPVYDLGTTTLTDNSNTLQDVNEVATDEAVFSTSEVDDIKHRNITRHNTEFNMIPTTEIVTESTNWVTSNQSTNQVVKEILPEEATTQASEMYTEEYHESTGSMRGNNLEVVTESLNAHETIKSTDTKDEHTTNGISETDLMLNTENPKQTTFHTINDQVTRTSQSESDVTTDALVTEFSTLPDQMEQLDQDNSQILKNGKICTKAVCKEKASEILQLMDHSMDPCEDFYQFSCGRAKSNDLASFRYSGDLLKYVFTHSNSKDKYIKSFQKIFGSCMKYENEYGYSARIEQVLRINIRDNNLTRLLSFLMLRQSTPLFEVRYGFVGGKDGYGMQILPPDSNYETTGLREWSLQHQIKKHCINVDPKLKYQYDINLVGVYEDYRTCQKTTFKRMAENFVTEKLERTKTSNNMIAGPTLQDALLHQKYSKTYIENLNQKYPQIDWQDFFNRITGKKFDNSTPIFLYLEKEYFEQIMDDLKERMLKTEKDVIETLKLYYQLELYQNLLTPKQNTEQFCMDQAIQLMPEIATKIFYEISELAGFNNSLVTSTFQKLKDAFYWIIEVSNLEEVKKTEYKFGLEKLTLKLFANDEAWENYLEESYQSYYLTDDYLSNVFMFVETNRMRRNSYGEVFLSTQFLDRQFSQVPTTIANTNSIVIPNTFLHKLSETQEYPSYIFESYLKFHLSRALALHLNDIDRDLSSRSIFYKQFLSSLNSNLENGDDTKIFRGQRLSYKPALTQWQQIIHMSETNRMADNIALDMTFKDISIPKKIFDTLPWIPSDYSNQHLFFVLIVQEFCESPTMPAFGQNLYESPDIPSTFRVDNMIMNSETFTETFRCPRGTSMNPEEKTQFEHFVAPPDGAYNNYYEYNEQANK